MAALGGSPAKAAGRQASAARGWSIQVAMRPRFFLVLVASAFALAAVTLLAQLPNQIPTDVLQTKLGELHIMPLPRQAGLYLAWAGRQIYVNPAFSANFEGWPKADLILINGAVSIPAERQAIAALKKDKTQVIAPAAIGNSVQGAQSVPPGQSKTLTLPNAGKPLQVNVAGVALSPLRAPGASAAPAQAARKNRRLDRGEGYVLTLGKTRLFLSAETHCTPAIRDLKDIAVAFIPIDSEAGMSPDDAAACVAAFRPKIVYPFHVEGRGAHAFAEDLKAHPSIHVRVRNW